MFKKIFLTFVAILLIGLSWLYSYRVNYTHNFAICAIFKNEAPFLKEWIDYHHKVLGASHFYLYNNDSTDNYQEVLEPYIVKGLAELIDWDSSEEHAIREQIAGSSWNDYQIGAYNDCIKKRALKKVKWLASIDIDEFIVPVQGVETFHKLLKKCSKSTLFSSVGSIQIQWRVFGTSHVWELNPKKLMIEQLYHRAKDNHGWNRRMVKSINRPEAIDLCYIHHAKLKKKYKVKKVSSDYYNIHHYWTGTEKRFKEKRLPTYGEVQDQFNYIEDRTIFQYFDFLK